MKILQKISTEGFLVAADIDSDVLIELKNRLKEYSNCLVIKANFADLYHIRQRSEVKSFDGILLDLGLSSFALDNPNRGMAHRLEGPLDLRFDRSSNSLTAAELIRRLSTDQLKSVLKNYGEIPRSAAIAETLKKSLPSTTSELREAISYLIRPDKREKTLSQIFQALRIAVNDEMGNLDSFLQQVSKIIKSRGRLVIISYHSLEDRRIKQFLRRESSDCICPPEYPKCVCGHKATFRILTPKAITPSEREIAINPRARSAKLRCGERI